MKEPSNRDSLRHGGVIDLRMWPLEDAAFNLEFSKNLITMPGCSTKKEEQYQLKCEFVFKRTMIQIIICLFVRLCLLFVLNFFALLLLLSVVVTQTCA